MSMSKVAKQIFTGVLVLVCIGLVSMSISIVGATERGIVHTFGKPSEEIKTPGLYAIIPFAQTMRKYSLVPIGYDVVIGTEEDAALTQDNQSVGSELRIFYAFQEDKLYRVATEYTQRTLERILSSNAINALKSVVGRYTIFDIATNQDEIRQEIDRRIRASMAEYPIIITEVNVLNWDWSAEFERQIRLTMERAQQVRQAEQEAQIAEQQNRKLAIEAEAQAKALVARAEGEFQSAQLQAQAAIEVAKGRNEANRLISQNLHVEVRIRELEIAKINAERWDGRRVPNYVPLTAGGTIVNLPTDNSGR